MTTIRKNKEEIMLRRQNSCFSLKLYQRLMTNVQILTLLYAYLRHIFKKTITYIQIIFHGRTILQKNSSKKDATLRIPKKMFPLK